MSRRLCLMTLYVLALSWWCSSGTHPLRSAAIAWPTLLLFHGAKSELNALVADSASEMRYSESNRATTVVCCGGAVRVVMFDILYASVYLKLNVGKWVASVTIEPGNLS